MLIVQISDFHIEKNGNKTLGIAPMAENLNLCIKHINQLNPLPDLVLVTGDISNSGNIEAIKYAKGLLDQLNFPYFVVPGNHDLRKDLIQVFGMKSCPVQQGYVINYRIDEFEIKFIALDTCYMGKSGGKLSETSCLWLERQLQELSQHPVIIFMHHPPLNLGVAETDIDGFEGKDKFAEIINKFSNIEAILCGHIHLSSHTRWNNTVVSTAPSIGMRLVFDFNLENESQFNIETPGYQVHYWTKEKRLITYDVKVSDLKKGHSFQ